jgi:GTP-binding protein HflX
MLADTVGFIRHLPPGLVASFRSTLEEIRESDMLLIVADAAHAHVREQIGVVYKTLEEMGAGAIPRLLVMNKADRIKDQAELARAFPGALFISARNKDGLAELKKTMAGMFPAAG